jgi:hypothetical protein
MKTFYLTTMTVVFLLLSSNGIQAQTTQTQLNQVELMKQWIGSWKCEVAKDTTNTAEVISFGNVGAIEQNWTSFVKGKIINEKKAIWGYDRKNDKYIVVEISKNNEGINLSARWFTSKNTIVTIPFEYLSNPEKATTKRVSEIKSPDLFISTTIENNKQGRTVTYTRVGK